MYSYEHTVEVRDQIEAMPPDLATFYSELVSFLELTPWAGPAYQKKNPDGAFRKMTFGRQGEGLATYVILEEQRRVVVINLIWVD